MASNDLEQRVAALEAEVAQLKAKPATDAARKSWRAAMGMFTGDEGMKQVFDAALKLREADRRKARRTRGKRKAKA